MSIVLNQSPIGQQNGATKPQPIPPSMPESLRAPSCWTAFGSVSSLVKAWVLTCSALVGMIFTLANAKGNLHYNSISVDPCLQ